MKKKKNAKREKAYAFSNSSISFSLLRVEFGANCWWEFTRNNMKIKKNSKSRKRRSEGSIPEPLSFYLLFKIYNFSRGQFEINLMYLTLRYPLTVSINFALFSTWKTVNKCQTRYSCTTHWLNSWITAVKLREEQSKISKNLIKNKMDWSKRPLWSRI